MIKSLFMELASKTTPHGYEYLMEPFLPGCIKDSFGNYYRIVGDGNHNTMFTSHLDTYFDEENSLSSNAPQDVQLIDLGEQVQTDCTSILGADDRAGIALMITMIKAGVPGLYAFFIGEEVGRLGSIHAAHHNEWKRLRKGIKNVISFDRKGCDSIITHQGINQTCSIEYATALQSAFLKQKMIMQLDEHGVGTDSLSFYEVNQNVNCTNISVGYGNAHTSYEFQNIRHLEQLCKAALAIDWNALV